MIEGLAEYSEILVPVAVLLSGIIGKLISDRGKAKLVKELDEAKTSAVKATKSFAPCLDLAYNLGTGKLPLDHDNLKKLSSYASTSWTDAKDLSREIKDVLVELEVQKGVVKP